MVVVNLNHGSSTALFAQSSFGGKAIACPEEWRSWVCGLVVSLWTSKSKLVCCSVLKGTRLVLLGTEGRRGEARRMYVRRT